MLTRIIPSSGQEIPILGLGTWQTFDVANNFSTERLKQVLHTMRHSGGKMIDSSPMYGNAETIVGKLTEDAAWRDYFFYATKVWTTGREAGIDQMNASFTKMKRTTMDLMQIHNLMDWKTHLQTLKAWKNEGKIKYIGITHYTDSMHKELEKILLSETIDFVQFNYSIFSKNAEKSLLDVAADRGVAAIINRPFGEGKNFALVKNKELPVFAKESDITSWAQFFLLYVISHPAVTVVIPATGDPAHALDNFGSGEATLPDASLRKKMSDFTDRL